MAEQKVSHERRRELEQIDPFQKSILKAMAYAKEHSKLLILVSGCAVAAILIIAGVVYSFQKAENKAALLVSTALKKYEINPDTGYFEIKKDFELLFSKYSNTKAAKLAKIKFAQICYDALEFDQSYKYYQEAFEIFYEQSQIKNFLLSSLGNVCLAKKEFEQAKQYFLQIKEGSADLLKDEAEFILASLYEADNNTIESKKIYETIVQQYSNSMYRSIAESKINIKTEPDKK